MRSHAQLSAKRSVGLIRPSIGPYLAVPPLQDANVRRIVSDLKSGVRNPTADALNIVTRVSADHAEPMRLSAWPELLPQLVTLVAVGVRWRDGYGERLAARLDKAEGGRRGGESVGGGGGDDEGGAEDGVVWEAPASAPATAEMGRAVTAGYSAISTTTTIANANVTTAGRPSQVPGASAAAIASAATGSASVSVSSARGGHSAGPRTTPELEAAAKRATKRRRWGVDDMSLWADVDELVGEGDEKKKGGQVAVGWRGEGAASSRNASPALFHRPSPFEKQVDVLAGSVSTLYADAVHRVAISKQVLRRSFIPF